MSAPATMPAERGSAPTRGAWIREVWESSVGKKQIVAITGFVLIAYVVLHMLGNLKAFQGAGSGEASIDSYAEFLRTVGEPVIPRNGVLWLVRALLLSAFVVHIVAVMQLTARNRAARPEGRPRVIQRSLSVRTMLVGGLYLLAFVVFHILHFTTGSIEPGSWSQGAVFDNLQNAFDSPLFVVLYVAAALALGFHLRHAVWSTTQTAGWDKPNRNPTFRRAATFVAVAVSVGFAAVPIAFWVGALG